MIAAHRFPGMVPATDSASPCITPTSRQISLGGTTVGCRCHVCALLDSRREEHEVMLPFVAEGVAGGDRVLQVMDHRDRERHRRLLSETGIGVDAAEQDGTLQLVDWQDSYLRGGWFDQHAMLALVDAIGTSLETPADAAEPRIMRAWANMNWAAGEPAVARDLCEYEARLNHVLPRYDMAVVCAYDVALLDAGLFVNILRAHPYVIIGGILRPNLFHVPPEQLLRELALSAPNPHHYS